MHERPRRLSARGGQGHLGVYIGARGPTDLYHLSPDQITPNVSDQVALRRYNPNLIVFVKSVLEVERP